MSIDRQKSFANEVYGKYLDGASFAFISSNTFSFKICFSIGVAPFGGIYI
jgi:hypothetical protein